MKIINKSLSVVLSIVMLFTLLPLNVFANAEMLNTDLSDEEKYEYTIDENSQTVTITGFKTTVTGDVIIPSELNGYPVTAIGQWAFRLSGVTSIFIPETVTEIGYEAFRSKQAVVNVDENNPYYHSSGNCLIETETKTLIYGNEKSTIPDDGTVTIIGNAAFRDSDLETIFIPNTITHIDHYAFSGTNLKQIVIPDSVTSMSGYCTFDGCRELESVYIGRGLEQFTSLWRIFAYCDNLTSVTVDEENPNFSSQGNCIINNKTKTLIAGCNNSTIPSDSNIECIGHCAFEGCSNLRSITIPDSVKEIQSYAFSECSRLQSIFIPKNVTAVWEGAFDYCSNLSEIKVDRDNLIYHAIDNCLIHTASKRLVQGCYNSIIPADGSVEHIGANAFYGQQKLYYMEIPEGVKTIGYSAFCSTSLCIVSLPSTLQTIGEQNFNGWGTLKYILYGGSEAERQNIRNNEHWEGQNSDFVSAQWYYNGENPFPDVTLSIAPVELIKCVDYDIEPEITVTYADGTTFTGKPEEVEELLGFPLKIYHNQTRDNQWDIGKHTAKLCCMDQSVLIDITVVDHPIERIEIQDVTLLETLNNGKYYFHPIFKIFFKDGSVKEVDYSNDPDPESLPDIVINGKYIDLTTNSWSLQEESPWIVGESYEVTGTLLDVTDTFTVTIKEKTLTNIAILYRPDKLTYTVGEPLDTTGLIVASYYDNGLVERITDYSLSGFDPAKVGKQTVTVAYHNQETAFQVMVLPIDVTGIDLDKHEVATITGESNRLNATVYPKNATNKTIFWSSSDPAIVSIDENGNIQALRAGRATISAITQDGNFCKTCIVYVICNHKSLSYHTAIAPDCINNGINAYYSCDTCDVLFKEDKFSQTTTANETINALGHTYTNDCDTNCNACKAYRDTTHSYVSATCTSPKTCTVCGVTSGKALGHTYTNACDTSCNICGATRTVKHDYKAATCTRAKTCKKCGVTSGSKLGHSYDKVVTKASATANGSIKYVCTRCDYTASNVTTVYKASKISLSKTTFTYNGKVQKPSVVVKDSKGNKIASSNYTVTYATGRKNVGTYKVTVKFKGNYSGTKTLTFKINPAKLSSHKLSTTAYTYDGKVKTPSITVKNASGTKLTKNTHYTVTYASGRKNVGTYKVTIKGKGNYTGTKTLTFKINPAKTTVSKLTAGKKSITVAITKRSTQVTGYQIQYSTSKTFSKATTKTISSYNTTKYTLKSLSAEKTYYVRVRTYKTVGKTKYYSGWSTYKYVKTK